MCTEVHISALKAQICALLLRLGPVGLGPVHYWIEAEVHACVHFCAKAQKCRLGPLGSYPGVVSAEVALQRHFCSTPWSRSVGYAAVY